MPGHPEVFVVGDLMSAPAFLVSPSSPSRAAASQPTPSNGDSPATTAHGLSPIGTRARWRPSPASGPSPESAGTGSPAYPRGGSGCSSISGRSWGSVDGCRSAPLDVRVHSQPAPGTREHPAAGTVAHPREARSTGLARRAARTGLPSDGDRTMSAHGLGAEPAWWVGKVAVVTGGSHGMGSRSCQPLPGWGRGW